MNKDPVASVLNTIRRFDMLKRGDKVLLSVSGGPDSIFLFYALQKLKDKLKISIFVANIDHSIRGRASAIDSEFVKYISESFKVPYIYKKIDPKVYRDNELSTEEIARKLRYDFLIKSAKKMKVNKIATGHTIDDHAETILMRIIKGTTLRGVIGIPSVREENDVSIIRPLIDIEKADIVNFLKKRNIPYRIDNTNYSDIYFRNTVRNRIMPYLSRYNPRIGRALANLAESLREDFNFIEEEKRKSGVGFSKSRKGLSLNLKDIIIQPKALRKEIIRDALTKAGANIKKLSYKHWKNFDSFIRLGQKGKRIDLPGGLRILKEKDSLLFFKLGKLDT